MPSLSPAHNKPSDRGNQKKQHALSSSSHSHSPTPSSYPNPHSSLSRKPTSSKGFLLSNTRVTRRRLIIFLVGSILLVFGWRNIVGPISSSPLEVDPDRTRAGPKPSIKRAGTVIKPVWLGSTGPKGRDGKVGKNGGSSAGKLVVAGFQDEEEETDYYADDTWQKGRELDYGRPISNDKTIDDSLDDKARHPHAQPAKAKPDQADDSESDENKNIGDWKPKPRRPPAGPGQKNHPAQPYRPRKGAGGDGSPGGRFGPARMNPQDEHEEQEEKVVKVEERAFDPEEEREEGRSEESALGKRPSRVQPMDGRDRDVQARGRYHQRPNIVDDPELGRKEERNEEDSTFKGGDQEELNEGVSNGLSRLGDEVEELDDEPEEELEVEQEDALVGREQIVMEVNEDAEDMPAIDTEFVDDDPGMFQWADDTGLRILTEKDLYGVNDAPETDESSPPSVVEENQVNPDGEEEMTPEQEWQAHLDRIQKMKERNRVENRRPVGFNVDDSREYEDEDQQLESEEDMDEESQWAEDWEEDGECEFMSVVDAYQMALTRLRKAKLAETTDTDTEDDRQTNQEELTEADYERFSHPGLASHIPPKTPGAHRFSRTGHLVLSENEEDAEHPIPQLLKLGERRWQEMVGRQSKTLSEAVDEYKRRYGRQPPRGFDIWWDFAVKNSLLLPDEYDRIHLDLAPFWALPRAEMRQRVREAMDLKETFVLVVENGTVSVEVYDQGGLDWGGTLPRAKDAASLIRPFSEYMPDMRAVFSIHDQPQIYLSATRRASLVELGLRGEHTSHLRESDSSEIRWERSCSRESNLRKPTKHEIDEAGSLVYDTQEASDICKNPYLMDLHGFTVEKRGPSSHPKPRTSLIPLFGLAKTSINSDILVTPLDQFANAPGFDPPWKYKRSDRIAWRGSSTGISWMDKDTPWRKSHRFRLHDFAGNRSVEEVSFIVPDLGVEGGPLKIRREKGVTKDLSEFFYDMQLAGEPLQCDEKDGTCDEMDSAIEFAEHQPAEELNDYKFLFDIDGNSWSGRFRRLMNTKSLVLKTGIFTEWFQPHLIPWFSYIPTRLDFSDLPIIMSLLVKSLRGSPEAPNDGFDEVAEAIASNGRCFTKKVFRVEDMQAYMFRLFLEYARLMAPTDENVDFVYDGPVAETDTSV